MTDAPDFARLLGPFLMRFAETARPAFLAALERGAADRYRVWAERSPEHAAGLLACAAREDEIARIAEELYPPSDATRAKIGEVLPEARDVYYAVFADLPLADQWRIQASAERQGANAWRGLAAASDDEKVRAELERCAALEEQSARHLDGLAGS